MSYHLLATLSPSEWLCIKVGSCVSHFNVSLIEWVKSQDSVLKPQSLKRKESRSGSNRGPSANQPGALPIGHTGSRAARSYLAPFKAARALHAITHPWFDIWKSLSLPGFETPLWAQPNKQHLMKLPRWTSSTGRCLSFTKVVYSVTSLLTKFC